MPIPRMTQIGDTFTATVLSCRVVHDGQDVEFYFVEYPGESFVRKRLGVDYAFLNMGLADPDSLKTDNPFIVYENLDGLRLTWTRTPPKRGTEPGWNVVKAAPLSAPKPEPVRAAMQAPEASAPPPRIVGGATNRTEPHPRPSEKSPDEKRAAVRERFDAEAERVILEVIPRLQKAAKKKKVKLGAVSLDAVFAAASGLVIGMEKRGCA